jgi:hypothetical protein
LSGPNQSYIYFLVRADGKYLIKRRKGSETSNLSNGWTQHPAIAKPDAQGQATNILEVDAKVDPRRVGFKVNRKIVYTADASTLQVKGIVGLRVNHNLDLHVEGFALHQ